MAKAFGLGDMASMGIPGVNPGQGAGLLETLELVRKAWGSFALPPGLTPTLDPAEIERRVAELKSIEQWLTMNLTMLRGTIQAFEIQQSTLSTLRSIGESGAAAVTAAAAAAQSGFPPGPPDEAGIADLDEAPAGPASAARSAAGARSAKSTGKAADNDAADGDGGEESSAMPFAAFASGTDPLAWWDMLQKQFGQVANAAMASIPMPGPLPGMPTAASPARETDAAKGPKQPAGQAEASAQSAAPSGSTAARKSGSAGRDEGRAEDPDGGSRAVGSRASESRASGSRSADSNTAGSSAKRSSAGKSSPARSQAGGSADAGSSARSTASDGRRRSPRSG